MPMSRSFAGWHLLTLSIFSLVATASAQSADTTAAQKTVVCVEGTNCSHAYIAGDRRLTLQTDQIVVAVRIGQLENASHYTVATVEVTNLGKQPLDVLPAAFTLEQLEPKPKVLRYVTPEKVESYIADNPRHQGAHAFCDLTRLDECAARQQAERDADRQAAVKRALTVKPLALLATTVAPEAKVQGEVWIEQSPNMRTASLNVPINGNVYQFNFVW